MIYQSQIFTDTNNFTLQTKINEWLRAHNNIRIESTKFSTQPDGWSTFIIIYSTIDKEIPNA